MRIIAGRWGGLRLEGADHLRPTSERVRESLLAILSGLLPGRFVDLMAGTGAVGLEAASRGARVVLVERDPRSLEVLHANVARLGAAPPDVLVVEQDALRFAARPAEYLAGTAFDLPADIVFADPPYDHGPTDKLLRRVATNGLAGTETLVVVQHAKRRTVARRAPELRTVRVDTLGETALTFLRRAEGGDAG